MKGWLIFAAILAALYGASWTVHYLHGDQPGRYPTGWKTQQQIWDEEETYDPYSLCPGLPATDMYTYDC